MSFPDLLAERIRSADYLRRCEGALRVAQLVGETAWRIQALADAVADAREAYAEWRELFRGACDACDGGALLFGDCVSCGR